MFSCKSKSDITTSFVLSKLYSTVANTYNVTVSKFYGWNGLVIHELVPKEFGHLFGCFGGNYLEIILNNPLNKLFRITQPVK